MEDTVRVNLLNKNAAIYVDDANKRREYATQAGELADKLKFPKGKAESLWIIDYLMLSLTSLWQLITSRKQ